MRNIFIGDVVAGSGDGFTVSISKKTVKVARRRTSVSKPNLRLRGSFSVANWAMGDRIENQRKGFS